MLKRILFVVFVISVGFSYAQKINWVSFNEALELQKESPKKIIMDVYTNWCGPCKMIAPILNEVADEYVGKIKICKVDVDSNPETAAKFNVRGIPTLLVFKNGAVEATKVGALSKTQLTEFVDGLL